MNILKNSSEVERGIVHMSGHWAFIIHTPGAL